MWGERVLRRERIMAQQADIEPVSMEVLVDRDYINSMKSCREEI